MWLRKPRNNGVDSSAANPSYTGREKQLAGNVHALDVMLNTGAMFPDADPANLRTAGFAPLFGAKSLAVPPSLTPGNEPRHQCNPGLKSWSGKRLASKSIHSSIQSSSLPFSFSRVSGN
jgi:hypothetical protein